MVGLNDLTNDLTVPIDPVQLAVRRRLRKYYCTPTFKAHVEVTEVVTCRVIKQERMARKATRGDHIG